MIYGFDRIFNSLPAVKAEADGAARHRAIELRREVAKPVVLHFDSLAVKALVRNLSRSGMMVEVRLPADIGEEVQVAAEGLPPVAGKLRWRRGGCAGIEFSRRLTSDEVARCVPANDDRRPSAR